MGHKIRRNSITKIEIAALKSVSVFPLPAIDLQEELREKLYKKHIGDPIIYHSPNQKKDAHKRMAKSIQIFVDRYCL